MAKKVAPAPRVKPTLAKPAKAIMSKMLAGKGISNGTQMGKSKPTKLRGY